MASKKQPFVLISKGKVTKPPLASGVYIFGPMSYTKALLLAQEWQNKGHWVQTRFAEDLSALPSEGPSNPFPTSTTVALQESMEEADRRFGQPHYGHDKEE